MHKLIQYIYECTHERIFIYLDRETKRLKLRQINMINKKK